MDGLHGADSWERGLSFYALATSSFGLRHEERNLPNETRKRITNPAFFFFQKQKSRQSILN
jgi:hypothetical protein